MIFDPFDVVTFNFPFVERVGATKRPAVILSRHAGFGVETGIAVVAMVTSARQSAWPLDIAIGDLASAGLRQPCVIRMKLNSASYQRIDKRIGTLAPSDRAALSNALRDLLAGVM